MADLRLLGPMPRTAREPDWSGYLRTWDRQQETFDPEREHRFGAMFDVLAAQLPKRFVALDLGCGPGSLTARMLRRFPRATAVAIDDDPVVLRIGQGALGTMRGRITWVDAKLAGDGWTDQVPRRRYDAALSTSALHWLRPADLPRLYCDLHRLLRPGGVFLNGYIMPWGPEAPRFRRIAEKVYRQRFHTRDGKPGWAAWERWWARAEKEPFLRPFFQERKARNSKHPHHEPPTLGAHRAALRRARFRETQVVWEDFENRVLLAVR